MAWHAPGQFGSHPGSLVSVVAVDPHLDKIGVGEHFSHLTDERVGQAGPAHREPGFELMTPPHQRAPQPRARGLTQARRDAAVIKRLLGWLHRPDHTTAGDRPQHARFACSRCCPAVAGAIEWPFREQQGLFRGANAMPIDEIEFECEESMEKAADFLRQELRTVRTGRASPGLVERLKVPVESYGSTMELRELASISVPEGNQLLLKPYDPGTLKEIERAIRGSELGITPMSDGKIIRLPVPPLSGERRQQLLSQVRKLGENQKVAIRNIRRDSNKRLDTEEKEKQISEDDSEASKERIQELTKKYEAEVDALVAAKAKEIEQG
jgi:ribosome recycling factor